MFEFTFTICDENGEDIEFAGQFDIEPYSPGGRDEPPSGGYATLEEVRLAGLKVDQADWGKIGLGENQIEEVEQQAYDAWVKEQRDRQEDAGSDAYDAWKDRQDRRDW